MSARTVAALIIVILLTVVIMQNPEPGDFTLVFVRVHLPKLIMLTMMSAGGLILGLLLGLPRSKKEYQPYPHDDDSSSNHGHSGTLSDEDRDYISEP